MLAASAATGSMLVSPAAIIANATKIAPGVQCRFASLKLNI
jgi:hypothetical protein